MDDTMKQDELLHDVRKTLNQISMNAELLKLVNSTGPENEEIQGIADNILKSVLDCSELLKAFNPKEEP
ncbi:histidine kinase [Pseudoalteromonas xiamenensis]|uniref:Histidine kinase n=1 Tax=Pseudoalteromonas xiamenensis TaxID=882626 RepID=A0A975HMR3_9GAMM|nr:histidine kinase [Pseudoalteromonas xiamenensis]QTH71380.1 histidine kinase [Pseudoalteromonas xiamenensis]